MNKYNSCIFAIVTLLLLSACGTANNDEYGSTNSPMNFDGVMASDKGDWAVTRTSTRAAFPTGEKLGVYAYNTGSTPWSGAAATATPNVMCNQMVEKTATGSTYTPVKYWVPTQYYSFFAYAPYNATGIDLITGSTTPGTPSLEYTMPESTAGQADILYAWTLDQKEENSTAVTLNFKHALARIRFSAQVNAGASQYTAKVTGVTFSGLMNKGTLSLYTGAWSSTSGNTTCVILDQNSAADDTDIPYSATKPEVALSTPMYILPQKVADHGEITIYYEIVSPFEDDPIKRTATFTQNVTDMEFESGESAHYHFTIKLTGVQSTLQVEDWAEKDDPNEGITSME